ncbi:hypothetical protein TNCT_416821 [Trichonephila clavata]|uniref:Uncharacterized protein n=1 Tax=Trichonephila clavata TaxID=2740835 RepID=A0A8X6GKD3_TRICU|nr:hypothetical protein TNCT_416821 [Trichonephila clavata]
MPKEDPSFANNSRCYKSIMIELENNDYPDIENFYEANQVNSEEEYLNILRAGLRVQESSANENRVKNSTTHSTRSYSVFSNPTQTLNLSLKNILVQLTW